MPSSTDLAIPLHPRLWPLGALLAPLILSHISLLGETFSSCLSLDSTPTCREIARLLSRPEAYSRAQIRSLKSLALKLKACPSTMMRASLAIDNIYSLLMSYVESILKTRTMVSATSWTTTRMRSTTIPLVVVAAAETALEKTLISSAAQLKSLM